MQRDVILIYGPTGSGKTTLAGSVIDAYSRVLVVDAAFGEFRADLFSDYEALLNELEKRSAFPQRRVSIGGVPSKASFRFAYTPNRNERGLIFETGLMLGTCLLVLEEADRFDNTLDLPEYDEAIIRGRHDGLSILAMGLRPSFLPKDLRSDVSRIYCFGLTDEDDLEYIAGVAGPKIYEVTPPKDGEKPPFPYLFWRRGHGAEIISPSAKPLDQKTFDKLDLNQKTLDKLNLI